MKKCIRIVHSVTALILATVICNGFKAGAQNVGIGTNTPLSNLHIRGGSAAGLLIDNINGIGSSGIEIKSSTTVNQSLFISHNNSNNAGTIAGVSISGLSMIHTGTASTAGLLLGTTNLHPIYFITNATKQMVITPEGRIAIGTNALNPNNNSVLDIQGTNGGLLIPRLTTAQRDAIPSPPNGLMLYNTTTNSPNYFKTGTGWVEVSGGVATPSWSLTGNIGTNANNFIGTLDPAPLLFRVNGFNAGAIHAAESIGSTYLGAGSGNVAAPANFNAGFGALSLNQVNEGGSNTAIGHESLYLLTNGFANTAVGAGSGKGLTTGFRNTLVGFEAGEGIQTHQGNVALGTFTLQNRKGDFNIAIGDSAMAGSSNDIPNIANIAIGKNALRDIRTASGNVAIGRTSMQQVLSGSQNVVLGDQAMNNTTSAGNQNVALGTSALRSNTGTGNIGIGPQTLRDNTANNNIAMGSSALFANTTGRHNIAIGLQGLFTNANASFNIAIGDSALRLYEGAEPGNIAIGSAAGKKLDVGKENTIIGHQALSEGQFTNSNVVIGFQAMSSLQGGGNNVAIGYKATSKNSIGVGSTAIGSEASAGANNSTAIGYQASVTGPNRMGFGNENVNSWLFGRTTATAGRALEVGTNNTNGNGAYLTTGGTWTNNSDLNLKEDISEIDPLDILKKVAGMPITRWKYKGTNEYHIGPMAQDFHAAFATGNDNRSISSIDPAGVSLAAIQALLEKIEMLEKEIATLKNR